MSNMIEIRNVAKTYPGVRALKDVSFDIRQNSVHCIVGENGAGKSTMIKILSGAEKRDSGEILLKGQTFSPRGIKDAMEAGMSVLYQELNIVDQLTVRENLVLGKEKSRFGMIQRSEQDRKMVSILGSLDPSINPNEKAAGYSVAQKQIIQIAKAIADEASVLIMDEPTAALTEGEIRRLFAIVKDLKAKGVTVVYISHRLEEIFEIGDFVTVFRDGAVVATKPTSDIENKAELIRLMLGKVVYQTYTPRNYDRENVLLSVRNLSNKVLKDVSFELYKGEILGFYGLIGAGKTEIARAIFGADAADGKMFIENTPLDARIPKQAIRKGIALVPEERRTQGLFTRLTIRDNIPLMNPGKIMNGLVTSMKKEKSLAKSYVEKLHIATNTIEKAVAFLSGGNQQKVVLAKCMNTESKVLMLDEPTRGVDIGAKEEIHSIIRNLADHGTSIMVFSSELSEIVNLCDRIVLLFEGEVKRVVHNQLDIDTQSIMHIVTGG